MAKGIYAEIPKYVERKLDTSKYEVVQVSQLFIHQIVTSKNL